MKLSGLLENAYLILVFSVLLLIGNANLWNHQLSHDFPYGYLASDAFQHQIRADAIKDAGNFRYEASYISHGFENAVGRYPPVIYHLAVMFSYLSGLQVYDAIYFIVFLFASLAAMLMYIIIRGANKNAALIALPMSLLIFANPNYLGFAWGHWPSILGQFFLIALFWGIHRIGIEKSFLLIGIFLSAIIMTHTSEIVFAGFFILAVMAANFLLKKFNAKDIKKLAFAGILALILTAYYLIIFLNSWFVVQPYQFSVKPVWEGNPGFYLADFKILLVFILIGLLLFFATIKNTNAAFLAGISMLVMGYGNYFGFDWRAFQLRFLWPIYLSVFFGFAVYYILKFFIKNWNLIYSILASAVFLALLLGLVNVPFIPHYQKLETRGIMDGFHWQALRWLSENTPSSAKIYFFYGDIYSQDALLRNSKRVHSQVDPNDFVNAINSRKVMRQYATELPGDGGGGIAYRKSFLSFGLYNNEVPEDYFWGKKDICRFDYFVFDKASNQQALAQYNLIIAKKLVEKKSEPVFENQIVAILKNNKVGGDCIEEGNF